MAIVICPLLTGCLVKRGHIKSSKIEYVFMLDDCIFVKLILECFLHVALPFFTGIYRDMLLKRTFNAKSVKSKS